MRIQFLKSTCLGLDDPSARSTEVKPAQGLVATLGSFDGLHLGHQSLLSEVKKEACQQGRKSAFITFSPHPAKVINAIEPKQLSSFRQQFLQLGKLQIDEMIVIPFNKKLAQLEAEDFVDRILIERYDVRHLIVGPYATIGRARKGSPEWIQNYFESKGLSARIVEPVFFEGRRTSSNQIRELISEGRVDLAGQLLGRPYSIMGIVKPGKKLGRNLGFPTANLSIGTYVKPPYGVYFGSTLLSGRHYTSVSNFGVRPTFESAREVLETHLLDYDGPEFYGKRIEVQLLSKIRDEQKFPSVSELQAQIKLDIEKARELIAK